MPEALNLPPLHEVVKNPGFLGLPPEEQRKFLGRYEAFQTLPETEQDKFLGQLPKRTRNITITGGGGMVRQPATPGFGELKPGPTATERAWEATKTNLPAIASTAGQLLAGAAAGPEAAPIVRVGIEAASGIIGGLLGRQAQRALDRQPLTLPTGTEVSEEALANIVPVLGGAAIRGGVALTKPEMNAALSSVAPTTVGAEVAEKTGTDLMRVADDAMSHVQAEEAAHYGRARSAAERLKLTGPTPVDLGTPAKDALDSLSTLGVPPSEQSRLTKILRGVLNKVEGVDPDLERVIGRGAAARYGKRAPTMSYGEADTLRRELQPYVTQFERRGAPVSPAQKAIDETYHRLKRHMRSLARGTEVDDALRTADEHFIHVVKPIRSARGVIARGQLEPQSVVDLLTSKRHVNKFRRFMERADATNPTLARNLRAAKFQRMVADSMDPTTGRFDVTRFERAWGSMPESTRRILTAQPTELSEFVGNLRRARTKLPRIAGVERAVTITAGLNELRRGNMYTGFGLLLSGGAPGHYWIGRIFASRPAIKSFNLAMRGLGAGASPNVVARLAAQGFAHAGLDVLEDAKRSYLGGPEPLGSGPVP